MRKNRLGKRLDVVGGHKAPALDRGQRLAGVEEVEGATRAGAECDLGIAARPTHQPRDVLAQLRLDEDIGHCALGRRQLVR